MVRKSTLGSILFLKIFRLVSKRDALMASQQEENKKREKESRKQQKEIIKWYFKHCLKYKKTTLRKPLLYCMFVQPIQTVFCFAMLSIVQLQGTQNHMHFTNGHNKIIIYFYNVVITTINHQLLHRRYICTFARIYEDEIQLVIRFYNQLSQNCPLNMTYF